MRAVHQTAGLTDVKLIAVLVLTVSAALPIVARSSDAPENPTERRQLEFSDRMQRLMQKYEVWSERYLRHSGSERVRSDAAKAALQRSTDHYIDRIARPRAGLPGTAPHRSSLYANPAYRQQYRRLQQSRRWTRKILNRSERFQGRPLRPRFPNRW